VARQLNVDAEIRRLQRLLNDPDCGGRRDLLGIFRNQTAKSEREAQRCADYRATIAAQLEPLLAAQLASQTAKAELEAELARIRAERDVAQTAITGETKAEAFAGVLDTLIGETGDVLGSYFNPAGSLGFGDVAQETKQAPPPVVESPGVVDWVRANPVPSGAIGLALVAAAYYASR